MSSSDQVRFGFGAAHLSKSLVWSLVDLLLAYFLVTVLRVDPERAARLLFIFLIVGALSDVVVGGLLTWRRAGKQAVLTLHVIGAVLTAATVIGQFALSRDVPWIVMATGLAFRVAFAVYDVPQTALTSMLPSNEADARRYVRLRTTLSAVARLGVTIANVALAQLPGSIFRFGGLLTVSIFAVAIVATALALHRLARRLPDTPAPLRTTRPSRPRGLILLLAAFLVSTSLLATLSRLLVFMPGRDGLPQLGSWLLLGFSVGTVAGPALAIRLEDGWGAKWACAGFAALTVLAGAAVALAPGIVPDAVLVIGAVVYGLGLGGVGAFLWEAATGVVMSHAARTGHRVDGLVFGAVIFTIQLSIALGALLLGYVLEGFMAGARGSAGTVALVVVFSGVATPALLAPLLKARARRSAGA